MQYYTTPRQILELAKIIIKHLIPIEIILVGLALTGLILRSLDVNGGSLILTFSLISLSIGYFLIPQTSFENNYQKFIFSLLYYTFSVAGIAIVYKLQHWPGGSLIAEIALVSLGLSIIFILIYKYILKKGNLVSKALVFRTLLILGILLLIKFLPLVYEKIHEVFN